MFCLCYYNNVSPHFVHLQGISLDYQILIYSFDYVFNSVVLCSSCHYIPINLRLLSLHFTIFVNPTHISFFESLMAKTLKQMSLSELWQLFPISLVPHRPEWGDWAAGEIAGLSALLAPYAPVISHVGSTAIPDMMAKPIIDILVEVPSDADYSLIRHLMEAAGYICMSASSTRISFNKGYTPRGYADRVFHVHLRRIGDNDELYFRDYLILHPEVAIQYQLLKQSLLPRFANDRDAYTRAKTPFITDITRLAKSTLPRIN